MVYIVKLQLFNSFAATFMTYLCVTNIPHVSIPDSPHMFFILSCAAVLVATFSFIAIIACRPRHHSRSRVIWLSDASLRLLLWCACVGETRQTTLLGWYFRVYIHHLHSRPMHWLFLQFILRHAVFSSQRCIILWPLEGSVGISKRVDNIIETLKGPS